MWGSYSRCQGHTQHTYTLCSQVLLNNKTPRSASELPELCTPKIIFFVSFLNNMSSTTWNKQKQNAVIICHEKRQLVISIISLKTFVLFSCIMNFMLLPVKSQYTNREQLAVSLYATCYKVSFPKFKVK